MKKQLAAALLSVALGASVALAQEWKEPEDGAIVPTHVDDLIAYFKALKKVGGTWHGQTSYVLADIEKKALNEASVDRLEVLWAKERVLYIAHHLAVDSSTAETWEKAEKKANEKLASAKKKIDDLMKNGPKELGELDEIEADLVKTNREQSDAFVATIIDRLKLKDAEKRHDVASKAKDAIAVQKTSDEIDKLRQREKQDADSSAACGTRYNQLRQRRIEIVEKLQKVGATEGMKQITIANEARRDVEEIQAAKAEKAASTKADPVFDPSTAAVKAKLGDLERALADLGSPFYDAVAPPAK